MKKRADLVGDLAEAGEIPEARIGRAAGDDQLRLVLAGEPLDLVHVDALVVRGARCSAPTLNHLPDMLTGEPWVRWPPAGEVEAHEGVARASSAP